MTLTIDPKTRRRYILGEQGLWPGRRWQGLSGVEQCLKAVQGVQIDPVSILSQSHDLVLWGRVLDYSPDLLAAAMYTQRGYFDYGGALFIYPMAELPYWRVSMARMKDVERWHEFANDHPDAIRRVLSELKTRGPLRKRDILGDKIEHYRGSKVSGVALYYLWLTGDLMTHHREGKERVYDLRDNVAPEVLNYSAETGTAEDFFALKTTRMMSLVDDRLFRNGWNRYIGRMVDNAEAREKRAELLEAGLLARVKVVDERGDFFIPAENLAKLELLASGEIPKSWNSLGPTTNDEVTFLSPLEYVSARGRAKKLFGFEYIWEIYKPAEKRRWGPYTLPILYGDQLVGRMDAKNNRQDKTLEINGLWFEEWFEVDSFFLAAFGRGLVRLAGFLETDGISFTAIQPAAFRKQVERAVNF